MRARCVRFATATKRLVSVDAIISRPRYKLTRDRALGTRPRAQSTRNAKQRSTIRIFGSRGEQFREFIDIDRSRNAHLRISTISTPVSRSQRTKTPPTTFERVRLSFFHGISGTDSLATLHSSSRANSYFIFFFFFNFFFSAFASRATMRVYASPFYLRGRWCVLLGTFFARV